MVIQARNRLASETNASERHLAIEIRSRLFGFAVFEAGKIIDWGIRGFASGATGRKIAIKKFMFLLKLYAPSIIIARRTRRARHESSRSSALVLKGFRREVERRSTVLVILDRQEVREFFARNRINNKQGRAVFITERFAQLKSKLPRARKKWEPERQIFTMFDAVATGMALEGRPSLPVDAQ